MSNTTQKVRKKREFKYKSMTANRTTVSEVFNHWDLRTIAQNHNGTLKTYDGLLEYANQVIAYKSTDSSPKYTILNPEFATGFTMNKHIRAVIKMKKDHSVMLLPKDDFDKYILSLKRRLFLMNEIDEEDSSRLNPANITF